MSDFEKVIIESASEGSASDLDEEREKIIDSTHDPPKSQVPITNTHTVLNSKIYHVGSGNIIGNSRIF